MKSAHCPLLAFSLTLLLSSASADEPLPFPQALDAAAIVQEKLDHVMDNSLILGNGDLNGLLYYRGGGLVLRLTKNDVWDARVDTSQDQPLLKVDMKTGKWTGGAAPESWNKPYPCPRVCGEVLLGPGHSGPVWQRIRAEGSKNSWETRARAAVMRIEGRAGASNGFSLEPLDLSTDKYSTLRVTLSGTPNARFYIDLLPAQGSQPILSSKWIDTPATSREHSFPLPAGRQIGKLILYTWTVDGKPAENRFAKVEFTGPGGSHPVDLEHVAPPSPSLPSVLDLRRAVARVQGSQRVPETSVRALADRNVFLIESAAPARLVAVPASYLPAATEGRREGVCWLVQELPGDPDWPGMRFAVAMAEKGPRRAAAVVTSLESKDCLADAVKFAQAALSADREDLVRRHEAEWERFWSASGVEVEDAALRAMWYRNVYFLRCVSKPGVEAVGLYAGLTNDSPPWHGSHTLNYNSEQTFYPAYITNHADLGEPYERMIFRYLPRARWFARQTYDCGGAHIPHNIFAHEIFAPETCKSKNHRMHAFPPFAQSLCVSGWAVQNLWYRYKYQPERDYLEKTAYPAVRDVALFYAEFLDRCPADAEGKAIVGPTYCPEHRGLGEKNCTADLAFMRYTLAAAVEGATVLGRDADLAARFRKALDRLPGYPTTGGPEPMVTDVLGKEPIEYNIAVPVLPVFPGDVVTWFSPEAEKRLFTRTIERVRWTGYNSSIILSVARARLSLSGTWQWIKAEMLKRSRPNGTITLLPGDSCGHFTEQFAAAGAVSELLLQSVGDVLRIFPAWPAEKPARFRDLRAQGGWLVSAEQSGGQVRQVTVQSTAGGRLRLLSPWPAGAVRRGTAGAVSPLKPDARGIVEIDAQQGERLVFTPKPAAEINRQQ